MDKLKNLLKSDTPTDEASTTDASGVTGKITGQGSHFPKLVHDSVTSPESSSDVNPSQSSATAAAYTAGPERGGSEHVGTIAPETSQTQTSAQGPSSYTISNAAFPKTESAADGSGTAAIGQTSTYSSSHLTHGDPVSSVIDTESRDPLTYKKPETSAGNAGVGPGDYSSEPSQGRTGLAGHENPYKTSTLDPRVDGGNASSNVGSTAVAGAGGALAGAGAAQAYNSRETSSAAPTAPPQSTLTTTTDPADRSAAYSASTETKGLDDAKPSETSGETEHKPSLVGRVLGAVGLGGAAGAVGAKAASHGNNETAVDESHPTTTTGLTTYDTPVQSGPGVAHHRKESIPTTAYPAGIDSPSAIHAPVGGTRPSHDSSKATGAAVGTTAAAVGAAAVSDDHYEKSQGLRENITGEPTGSAPVHDTSAGYATTGVPSGHYSEAKATRENIASGTTRESTTTAAAPSTTETTQAYPVREASKGEDHTARNVALGAGAGAAVAGAGAYGAQEYSKKQAEDVEKAQAEAEKQAAKAQQEREKEAEKAAKEHQKEIEKAEKQHQKEIEKEEKKHQKEVEKHQKEVEKEEKKHQKEVEKHEKEAEKHQKEVEKEEKAHQKAVEKEEKEAEKERKAAEKEAAVREKAAEQVAAAEASTQKTRDKEEGKHRKYLEKQEKHEKKQLEKEEGEEERKPSLFKRIFKRRKNEHTGEEEEYSTDEDEHKGTAIAGGTALAAGAGAGAAAYSHKEHEATGPTSSSVAHTDPSAVSTTTSADPLASTAAPSGTGAKGFVSTGPDGQPSYTVVPQAASQSNTTSTPLAASDVAGERDPRPREPVTGLPYDPAKDPSTAAVLSQHHAGPTDTATSGTATDVTGTGHTSLEDRIQAMQDEKFGVIEETRR